MRTMSLFVALSLATSTLVACSAEPESDDALGEAEGEKRIKPKDSEALAKLQVNWPQGWQAPVNPAEDATVSYRNSGVAIGVASRLKEGDGCLALSSKWSTQVQDCTVALQKNKTTTYDLSAVKVAYDLTPAGKLATDFGPKPTLSIKRLTPNSSGAPTETVVWNQGNTGFFNGSNARGALALPGDYVFSWGLPILDDTKEAVAKGKVETVDLNPAEKRATIRIKAPTRELPNANMGCIGNTKSVILVQRNVDNSAGNYGEPSPYNLAQGYTEGTASDNGIVQWRVLPLTADTDVRVFPFTPQEGAMHYELVVNGVPVPLDAKPGKTLTVNVDRLDIDHVEVEKEDGSTYQATGTYQVFRQGPNNSWIPLYMTVNSSWGGQCNGGRQGFSAQTGTGLDLPYGTYRVLINYSTAEGNKQKDEVVTLP